MLETITFNGKEYPKFQSLGNASQFSIPFARYLCSGFGVDVGCNRKEWAFPGAIMVDPVIDPRFDATNFPPECYDLDYIYSSHCLEHLDSWVEALDYWIDHLKFQGVLFLYLPHPSQEYWLPWNNRKHKHILNPVDLRNYFTGKKVSKLFISAEDLNNSFYCVVEK